MSEEAVCATLLDAGALDIRDVDGAGEDPFHYSSGNFGPGYVDVKGTVAKQAAFKPLVREVAIRLVRDRVSFDFIAGNATGGMVPAYECREQYQEMTGREDIEYVYIRGSRKQGGQGELVTGLQHVERTRPDGSPSHALVMEELVNFAETTTNSLLILRELGFEACQGATILFYDHDAARSRLDDNDINLTALTTLPRLLDAAENQRRYPAEVIDGYREFLGGPEAWMEARGIEKAEHQKG
jgi:orotate phosphoribosyltransferase